MRFLKNVNQNLPGNNLIMFNTIEFEIKNNIAKITLNRPYKLNSFNAEMHEEVRNALKEIKNNNDARCLLLTANGKGFCAGQDLSDRNVAPGEDRPNLGSSLDKNYNPLIRTLVNLEIPVICAVNGVAAGAGVNIALACDIVLAARSASFIQAFCKIGLVPDSGGTWQLVNMVGRARAMALAMLGDTIQAERAEELGLIWRCVDDDRLQNESQSLAEYLAQQPTLGLSYIKRAINAAASNDLNAQLNLERDLQELAGRTNDYVEGVKAFTEKRQPNFSGT